MKSRLMKAPEREQRIELVKDIIETGEVLKELTQRLSPQEKVDLNRYVSETFDYGNVNSDFPVLYPDAGCVTLDTGLPVSELCKIADGLRIALKIWGNKSDVLWQ